MPEACATVADGKVVDIDLGRANGEPFLNVASAGLSVAVTAALSPRLKRYIGPLAYGIATLSAYARHKAFPARLLTSRRVRLITEQPLPVNLDGEIATTTPTDFTVQRNAVHVVVPQSSTSALFDGPDAANWPPI